MRHINQLVHLICIFVIVIGHSAVPPVAQKHVLAMGYFGLSGALTNWLAIHMLFEKVPGIYGSGIVPMKFEAFKTSIFNMVMREFFSLENIKKFTQERAVEKIDFESLIDDINMEFLFDGLIQSLMTGKVGNLISLVGGQKIVNSMREPFSDIIRQRLLAMTQSEEFRQALQRHTPIHLHEQLKDRVTDMVRHRLDELTPEMVKQIVQNMIRSHLGWLVVWGGVFGGLIGLGTSFLP